MCIVFCSKPVLLVFLSTDHTSVTSRSIYAWHLIPYAYFYTIPSRISKSIRTSCTIFIPIVVAIDETIANTLHCNVHFLSTGTRKPAIAICLICIVVGAGKYAVTIYIWNIGTCFNTRRSVCQSHLRNRNCAYLVFYSCLKKAYHWLTCSALFQNSLQQLQYILKWKCVTFSAKNNVYQL